MKKWLLITVLIVMITFPALAFEKGTKSIGGSLGFSSYKFRSDDDAGKTLSISPNLGYFIMDNLIIDLSPSFQLSWKEGFDSGIGFSIGIGARYFITKFYTGFMFDYLSSGTKGHMGHSKKLTLLGGYLLPVVKNIFLNMGVYYNIGIGNGKTSSGYTYKNDTKTLTARAGISIFFK
jgi:hypothetical protein